MTASSSPNAAPGDDRWHAPPVPRVTAYVADVAALCAPPAGPLVSLILFGSAATGGYSPAVSDVDLLVVIADWPRSPIG